jgi:hypothetical protein
VRSRVATALRFGAHSLHHAKDYLARISHHGMAKSRRSWHN